MNKDKWAVETLCTHVWYGSCENDEVNGVRHECILGPHITGKHQCSCGDTK